MVRQGCAPKRHDRLIARGFAGRKGRVLVVALDIPFAAAEEDATIAWGRPTYGLGGERRSAVAVDSRCRGQEPDCANRSRREIFFVASGGGQRSAQVGAAAAIGRRVGPGAEKRGRAAGVDSNRA